jgi:hypothetical protein
MRGNGSRCAASRQPRTRCPYPRHPTIRVAASPEFPPAIGHEISDDRVAAAGPDGAAGGAGAAAAVAPDALSRRVRATQQVARGNHAGGPASEAAAGRGRSRPVEERPGKRGGIGSAAGRINPVRGLIGSRWRRASIPVEPRRAAAQWTSAVRRVVGPLKVLSAAAAARAAGPGGVLRDGAGRASVPVSSSTSSRRRGVGGGFGHAPS